MRSCGIIAEYNPLHNGHLYHLQQARFLSGSDVVVVAMSGNFVQRGEPAVADKWARAEAALAAGADIVTEIPVLGSVQSADLFAAAGIRLLHTLRCSSFSFGTENGTAEQFLQAGRYMREHQQEIDTYMQQLKNDGRPYAAQMQEALEQTMGKMEGFSYSSPNNQLGIGYVKENLAYPHPLAFLPVLRTGAGHNDLRLQPEAFSSGTAIRQALFAGEETGLIASMPEKMHLLLQQHAPVSWEQFWPLLKYRLMTADAAELRNIYQVEEGLEYRLKKYAVQAGCFEEFMQLMKNKRWSWVRLQRVCLYILLNISREEMAAFLHAEMPVRILGFSEAGRSYLKWLRQQDAAFLTNIRSDHPPVYESTLKADRLYYQIQQPGRIKQMITRPPIVAESSK